MAALGAGLLEELVGVGGIGDGGGLLGRELACSSGSVGLGPVLDVRSGLPKGSRSRQSFVVRDSPAV